MRDVPSDVVELIIAVDLNPSDPEEPINVNDVKVRDKGEGEGEDVVRQLIDTFAGLDPKYAELEGQSPDEALATLKKLSGEDLDTDMDEASAFDKAMDRKW